MYLCSWKRLKKCGIIIPLSSYVVPPLRHLLLAPNMLSQVCNLVPTVLKLSWDCELALIPYHDRMFCWNSEPKRLWRTSKNTSWSARISKVKCSRYRPGVAQRVGRGIALLFHDRGTRRGWVVSSTPRPHFTPGKYPVPILQEGGWAPGPVWTGGKFRPHRDSIPDRPVRSQSLYRLSYRTHARISI